MTANDSRTGVSTVNSPGKSQTGLARRLFKWFFWVCLSLPLLGVLGVLLYSYVLDYAGSRELNAALAEAKKRGVPVDFEDPFFSKWKDAAALGELHFESLLHRRAFGLIIAERDKPGETQARKTLPVVGEWTLPEDPRDPLQPEIVAAAKKYLEGKAEVFSLLCEGAKRPGLCYPVDWVGPETLLPHLTWARHSARLLVLKAIIDAEEGRGREALELLAVALATGQPLSEEPALISALVVAAIDSIVTDVGLPRVMSRTDLSNDDLSVIQERFQTIAAGLSMKNALCGEVSMMPELCRMAVAGQLLYDDQQVPYGQNPSASLLVRRAVVRIDKWLHRGSIKATAGRTIIFLLECIEQCDKPASPVLVDSNWRRPREARLQSPVYPQSPWAEGQPTRGMWQLERTRAKMRAAAACITALRCRNDTGKWPESLDALVPRYLPEVPIDPFTAKPLVYRVMDDGVMAYSIGPNLTDDGGEFRLGEPRKGPFADDWAAELDDAAFKLRK